MGHSWHGTQPTPEMTPEKKPSDVHSTSERQSSLGAPEEQGGKRTTKIMLAIGALIILGIAVTLLIDVFYGSGPF